MKKFPILLLLTACWSLAAAQERPQVPAAQKRNLRTEIIAADSTGELLAQLRNMPGQFTPSPFVQRVTGVDNVCERAAVLDADGSLFCPKFACNGVTFALACRPFAPDWRWQNA